MPLNLVVLGMAPTRSEHSAGSSSQQLLFKITYRVCLKDVPGQTSPVTAKTAAVTFGTSLHLWNTNPSAVRSDLSQQFASLGLDSEKQKSLIQTMETRVCDYFKSEQPRSNMSAFKVDITHIKSLSSPEARKPIFLKSPREDGVSPQEKKSEWGGDGPICSMCLEEMAAESGASTPCGHVFHGHCIATWRDKSTYCPLCRRSMLDKTIQQH